jgi:hypothetical protein
MLDEIRNHDPNPTAEERLWTVADPIHLVLKAVGLAAVAIAIGVSVSGLLLPDSPPRQVTMSNH